MSTAAKTRRSSKPQIPALALAGAYRDCPACGQHELGAVSRGYELGWICFNIQGCDYRETPWKQMKVSQ